MLKLITILLAASAMYGCVMTSSSDNGPNGRRVVYIDGISAGVAYNKAAQRCPRGYAIIGEPRQSSPLDYTMTVECK